MRLHRYFVQQSLGEELVIQERAQIHQWSSVLRYKEGDSLTLFNGDGNDYLYKVVSISPKEARLTYVDKQPGVIPKKETYLLVSCIKKDLFELLVQKATECGVTHIIPIVSEHTERKNLDTSRLEKIIIEAGEQSGRTVLPTITAVVPFKTAFADLERSVSPENTYVASLHGESITTLLKENLTSSTTSSLAFVIGPEGGWGKGEEIFFAEEKRYRRIRLGDTVLRAETAAIICAFLSTLL